MICATNGKKPREAFEQAMGKYLDNSRIEVDGYTYEEFDKRIDHYVAIDDIPGILFPFLFPHNLIY